MISSKYKIRVTLVILLLSQVINIYAQNPNYNPDKIYSVQEMHAELDIIKQSLEDIHPSFYAYISKEEFQELYKKTKSSIDSGLNELDFQIKIRKLLRHIGCGHTAAKPSEDWYDMFRADQKRIPIQVYIHKDQMFVRYSLAADSVLLNGTEITSIDGVTASEIIEALKSIQQRDGYGSSYVSNQIESLFQLYLIFLYGIKDQHEIEFIDQNNKIQSVIVETQNPDRNLIKMNSDDGIISKISGSKFYYLDNAQSTAVLDIDKFGSSDYKDHYKEIFSKLEKDQIENLVIDLRNNVGGYFPNTTNLLRYLLDDNISLAFSKPRKKIKRKEHLSQNISAKITAAIFKIIPDRNRKDPNRNHKINHRAFKKNHFNNKIYVLTNGGSFSMSSYMTAKLRHHTDCTIIGEETGGTEIGSNAIIWYKLILPHTKIQLLIPRFFIDHEVVPNNEGRGVIPDIPIKYELSDKLERKDLELKKLLEILDKN